MILLFDDDFTTFNTADWFTYTTGYCYGRTLFGFGGTPAVVTDGNSKVLRLNIANYNAGTCGGLARPFQGTEIMTNKLFAVPAAGNAVQFEARIRATTIASGVVYGFFPYIDTGVAPYPQDEIDFEFLGKSPFPNSTLWLNTWNNGAQSNSQPTVTGLNFSQWNIYKIRWAADRIQWFVNDVLVRSETNTTYIPNQPLKLHLNAWVPDSTFSQAYDVGLPTTPATSWHQDVDYTVVTSVASTSPLVTVTTPVRGSTISSLPSIGGTVYPSPTVGGTINRVDIELYRLIIQYPNAYFVWWTGSTWSTTQTVLTTTLSGNTWSRSSSLPSGANLPSTAYDVRATAYDSSGNSDFTQSWFAV